MTALRIERFMGMAPKLSNRLLPDNAASSAQNARLLSGELRGVRTPSRIHQFSSGTNLSAYRLYKSNGTAVWLGLTNADSDVVKGPLVNDSYNRHYWTGEESYVAYNSDTRIENGDAAYRLGVPGPTAAASLAVSGGSGTVETRAYTYTFVNEFGEESAPAPVVSESGYVDGSWDLTSLPSTAVDTTNRATVTNKRVYRTVTGLSTVAYYFVAEITLAATTYSDTSENAQVALNSQCLSFGWDAPPDDLSGLTLHPGGFLVGFVGTDLYMSERYRPHAWPSGYVVSVEHEIVGLDIYNNMLTVLTKGYPYFFAGSRPENMTPVKAQSAEPCLSKASIASTLQGVMYASTNGLILFNEGGPSVVSRAIMSVEEWDSYSPASMRGAKYGEEYLGFYSSDRAIRFAPAEEFGVFVEIDLFDQIDDVVTDHTSGDLWLVRNNEVYEWEPPSGTPLYYSWTSKVFDFTRPINFGAMVVKAEGLTIEQNAAQTALLAAYNVARFTADPPDALNPINFTPLNGKRTTTVSVGTSPDGIDEITQNKYPLGGTPLYDTEFYLSVQTQVNITVYAKGEAILTIDADPNRLYRLPSGFKSDRWQFKFVGNSNVYSFAIAETPKELQNV